MAKKEKKTKVSEEQFKEPVESREEEFKKRVSEFAKRLQPLLGEFSVGIRAVINRYGPSIEYFDDPKKDEIK